MSQQTSAVLPGAIADALRADVIDAALAPGETVTEAAVAVRFGVARSTARLAIEKLVADGLLRREAHRAARVPELTRDDIADLYATRSVIEGAAMRRLAEDGAVPADALVAHRGIRAAAKDGGAFAALDIAFHRALVAGQRSPRLARTHEQLMGEVELGIGQVQAHALMSATTIAEQHEYILAAVIAGDGERAERLAREHVASARDALLAHYDTTHAVPPTAPTTEG
jgi:DNA-binding GntR family transcriptional regulator